MGCGAIRNTRSNVSFSRTTKKKSPQSHKVSGCREESIHQAKSFTTRKESVLAQRANRQRATPTI